MEEKKDRASGANEGRTRKSDPFHMANGPVMSDLDSKDLLMFN